MKFSWNVFLLASCLSLATKMAVAQVPDEQQTALPDGDPAKETSADAPSSGEDQPSDGYYIFVYPDEKAKKVPYVKVGSTMTVKWKVDGYQPETTVLQWRSGIYPDVSKWTTISDTIPGSQMEYNWTVPKNFLQNTYILMLTSPQKQVRARTSQQVKIYQGTTIINGQIFLSDAPVSNGQFAFTAFVLAALAFLVV